MHQPDESSPQNLKSRQQPKRNIEWVLGLIVASLLAVAAIPGVKSVETVSLDNPTVRGVEELLLLARDEAVQTGDDHIVFFGQADGAPVAIDGLSSDVMAWLIRDRDADGLASKAEYIASVPADAQGAVVWGSGFATHPATGDVARTINGPLSFSSGSTEAVDSGLVFRRDGVATVLNATAAAKSTGVSGAGIVYLKSKTRDYALVLSPWGDIQVQIWDNFSSSWRLMTVH
jgi:hypothetical protein